MENQTHIAATPEPANVSPAPVSTAVRVSFTTDRFPAWMDRHQIWIAFVVAVMTLVALLGTIVAIPAASLGAMMSVVVLAVT